MYEGRIAEGSTQLSSETSNLVSSKLELKLSKSVPEVLNKYDSSNVI